MNKKTIQISTCKTHLLKQVAHINFVLAGYTYSKYNTLMHFLSVMESYWSNPDVNNIQVFGKDIRTLLAVSCQKIFFQPQHGKFKHLVIACSLQFKVLH